MSSVRVGVIGVGGMGSFHARTLASLADVDVVAVADPFEPNARAIQTELGCRVAEPAELARAADLDGIVIASPDETHADLTVSAMAQGTAVLCEKPLATTVVDARRVVDVEVAAGRRLVQVGFMREYDPAHVQLASAIAGIGPVHYLRTVHRNANTTPRPLEQIVGQSLVHDIHSVRFLTGDEIVDATAFGSGPCGDSYRHVVAVCGLASGGHAVVEFDDGGFGYEVGVEVLGARGDALTGPPTRAVTRRDGAVCTDLGSDWFGWFAEAYRRQDQAWIDAIRAGTTVGPSAWDGFVAQLVVDAVLGSLAGAGTVPIELPDRPPSY